MKSALIRHTILSAVLGVILFWVTQNYAPIKDYTPYIWLSFLFLNGLFFVLYRLIFMTLQTKSQSDFMPLFALTFGLKFFSTLALLVYLIFVEEINSKSFILLFFMTYLSFTFMWMYAVWQKSSTK
jgi:hypothetical protein